MNKVILVMNKPSSCMECPLCQTRKDTFYCGNGYTGERGDMVFDIIARFDKVLEGKEIPKPDSCPLKELPEKQVRDYPADDYVSGWDDGWDACIEILSE